MGLGDMLPGVDKLMGDLGKTREIMQNTTLVQLCVNLTGISISNKRSAEDVVQRFYQVMEELTKQKPK